MRRTIAILSTLIIATLACNFPSAQREEVRTNPFTGEEEIDEYVLSDDELIQEYMDEALEQLAIGDGCDSYAVQQAAEDALDACKKLFAPDENIQACMSDQMKEFRENYQAVCITPTIRPLEDTETPSVPDDPLNLLDFETRLVSCDSESEGDYYVLSCTFSVTVELEFAAPSTPAFAFCRLSTRTDGSTDSVELTDLNGETTLTMELGGIMRQFENGESPVAGVDGYYANLSCFLGEFEESETSAWDSFYCKHPDVAEKDCEGPWMDFSGWSP